MSRLDYAPKLKEIEITDIKRGLGVFVPKPERAVSFNALKNALKKAGYALDSAEINVAGVLRREGSEWWLVAAPSGQRFSLRGGEAEKLLAGVESGRKVELTGGWTTEGKGTATRETIAPRELKHVTEKSAGAGEARADDGADAANGVSFVGARFDTTPAPRRAALAESDVPVLASVPTVSAPSSSASAVAARRAPIRTSSPGLTVYKGGAVVPRLYLVKQHLGNLEVWRQVLDLSVSYTPSQRVQLEVEVPLARTSYDDGVNEGANFGLGNITLSAKYRFFRSVKTYGDRQAAARFGLELPTGKSAGPPAARLNAPEYVRQQLTPISGGLSPHFDLSFSQAGGRFIFGGNVEAVARAERDGFRLGHELRVNTDLEYVLLPRNYETPGGELFVLFETNFVRRGRGRVGGAAVEGSGATEFYVAPGLQYAAHPRFVVEGSIQLPVVRDTGPLALRTDRSVLLGVRYLF